MAATQFDVIIVSPDQTLFEGQAVKLMAPTITQDIAILPDHTPLYSQLKKGTIIITDNFDRTHEITIEGGIIRVKRNRVSIIVGFDILRH